MFFLSCQSLNPRKPAQEILATTSIETIPKTFDRLVDYTPYNYEVLFTDPVCGVYKYTTPTKSVGGKNLTQKPENVFCKNKYDLYRSGNRTSSPQYRILEWINDVNTKEIFFTYLSFRNKAVKNALCDASKRGVKIHFVMSSSEDKTAADELVACSPENVQMKGRGLEGDLGYAHNKFFIVNPNSTSEFKISFSSGNMTSGPVIHHENWNFITTNPASHFAQIHKCVMNAEWDDSIGRNRVTYMKSIQNCRLQITAPEEKDIHAFFIPGEGEKETGAAKKTASDFMIYGDNGFPGIINAKKIWLGCHRFFYNKMVNEFSKRMLSSNKPELRIVADDDTYYKANDSEFTSGDTMPAEWVNMKKLRSNGAEVKFLETNSDEHQLHHSKYLLFADWSGTEPANPVDAFKAVLTGSANLTGAGFKTNWENIYYITIPEVVKKFAEHYVHTWNDLATAVEDLPLQGNVTSILIDQPIIKTIEENPKVEK